MDIKIAGIDFRADLYDLKEALAKTLHGPDFHELQPGGRIINFQVQLAMNDKIDTRNVGTGKLTVPTIEIGNRLIQLVQRQGRKIFVCGRPIRLACAPWKPHQGNIETLLKVPYQLPSLDRENDEKRRALNVRFRVEDLQFGIWGVRPSPSQGVSGTFCREWHKKCIEETNAQLWFDYDHKLLRIQLGDPAQHEVAFNVVIRFSTLRNFWYGYDFGNAFLCFDLLTPAVFESEGFHRALTGVKHQDRKKYRKRIRSIDNDHARISPYAHHVRLTFHESSDLNLFIKLCQVVGLKAPLRAEIESEGHEFFLGKQLAKIEHQMKRLPWSSAFQIEALLHNGLLTTEDLRADGQLWKEIARFCQEHPTASAKGLRAFHEELLFRHWRPFHPENESLSSIFNHKMDHCLRTARMQVSAPIRQGGSMDCYHVTFTPTRMSLEGPYAIQSNRVIRQFADFIENFIRVDFRDEDRLQYHFEYEVDGETLVREQVGGILGQGFSLAGRHFEFLGYSSSALRDHSVWFVHPFEHPQRGLVTASKIRRSLGDFSGERLRPAKYAARLGQAFTATNPSICISASQWKMIRDMGDRPYQHTDGNGTISRGLALLMWERTGNEKKIMPSVWQIRFLGFKGVVSIDDELPGVMMCLRASMQKFRVHEVNVADIEIVQEFCFPIRAYLNRQLVMVLEGRGVPAEAFLELQRRAVANVLESRESSAKLCSLMASHNLGSKFGLVPLLRRLSKLTIGVENSPLSKCLENPFFGRVQNCAIDTVLRDIKHRARIPVPESWHLVGVVDEGPAYIAKDPRYATRDLFTLGEGEIYVCVQTDIDSQPIYLKGYCVIGRSPTVHPGDVQCVLAVGKPPDHRPCLFRNLKNCVVLPCVGKRSLASYLGGGDVDGDTFHVIHYQPLIPTAHQQPANYPPVDIHTIEERDLIDPSTGKIVEEMIIPHIHNFIVDYINSDVLGLLSDKHLIRADQASKGVYDEGCLTLAQLCSQAVDYPKNGKPVDLKRAPPPLIRYKPDWKKGEVENARDTEFYTSETAMGQLFRAVDFVRTSQNLEVPKPSCPLAENTLFVALEPLVNEVLGASKRSTPWGQIAPKFEYYVRELRYICLTHTLTDYVGVRLTEEEVVIGTLMAHCSSVQRKWRQERIYRMGYHVGNLVAEIRGSLSRTSTQPGDVGRDIDLDIAWTAWCWTMTELEVNPLKFGLNSFGIICLNTVLDCVELLLPKD